MSRSLSGGFKQSRRTVSCLKTNSDTVTSTNGPRRRAKHPNRSASVPYNNRYLGGWWGTAAWLSADDHKASEMNPLLSLKEPGNICFQLISTYQQSQLYSNKWVDIDLMVEWAEEEEKKKSLEKWITKNQEIRLHFPGSLDKMDNNTGSYSEKSDATKLSTIISTKYPLGTFGLQLV